MITLARVIHGSRLYGLAGPTSDHDWKGIHLPSLSDCVLLQAPRNTRQKTGDIEFESFALQEFLKLAANGESFALDMLHCANGHVLESSAVWEGLRERRACFYTKKMAGSLGYARNMALKYGYRADRMEAVAKVRDFLVVAHEKGLARLHQCWDDLPAGDHIWKGTDDHNRGDDKRVYEVAGKKLQATVAVEYALEIIDALFKRFGDRVTTARNLGGTDWKAISHSFRVGYQLLHIYRDGGFKYPLPETEFLRDVKFAKLNYLDDRIDEKLNELIVEVEKLAEASDFPSRVAPAFIQGIILHEYAIVS